MGRKSKFSKGLKIQALRITKLEKVVLRVYQKI